MKRLTFPAQLLRTLPELDQAEAIDQIAQALSERAATLQLNDSQLNLIRARYAVLQSEGPGPHTLMPMEAVTHVRLATLYKADKKASA